MYRLKHIISRFPLHITLSLVLASPLWGQETSVFSEAKKSFDHGLELYDHGLFGAAEQSFERAAQYTAPLHETPSRQFKLKSELMAAQSAVARGSVDGDERIRAFIDEYRPDPLATEAVFQMGNYYYNKRKYQEAIRFYDMIETEDLAEEDRSEALFKKGYCHFVQKEFQTAVALFEQTKEDKTKYFYPANYYYGMSQYFLENYDRAVSGLQNAGHSRTYDAYVPFYLTAIYFAKSDYDAVIEYAPPLLAGETVRNEEDIHLLLAQAYFEKEEFRMALPHFRKYEERAGNMRPEDLYMMAYSAYRTGHYEEAADDFKSVSGRENELAQQANFYLGDCYLKLGDKQSARTAFSNAARLDADADLKAEATFQYAKLSIELGYDREAVRALQYFQPDSDYYLRGQQLLKNIFLNTRDYARAIDIIEQVPQRTPDIREAYQKVTYYRALQYLSDDHYPEAMDYLEKSLDHPIDQEYRAMALYWKGDIEHRQGSYQKSSVTLNKYFTLAKKRLQLPGETSIHVANYLQGYNYMKLEEYTLALGHFRDAAEGIRLDEVNLSDPFIQRKILADALVRAGDCYFKRNQYDSALKQYDEVIELEEVGFVYALYQKALILGLKANRYEKILTLEDLIRKYPHSNYADDALLEMGDTYMVLNQFDEASKPLLKLVSDYQGTSPLVTEALLKLGLISYNQGDVQNALSFYKRIFDHNPTAEDVRGALRAIEEIYVNDLGKPDEYVAFVEEHAGMDVNALSHDSLSFRSAYVQYENGNYSKAVEGFDNYLEQFPEGVQQIAAHYYRGESFLAHEQYSEALRDYETVVREGQGAFYADALKKAAVISYNHAQDFDKALQYYEDLHESANTLDVRHEAAVGALRSAERLDRRSEIKHWADLLLNSEQSTGEERTRAHFLLGEIAYEEDKTDEALSHLNEVTGMSNNAMTAEARYLIAKMYYEQGEYDTAEKLCREAIQESSSYPAWVAKTLLLLSDTYIAGNDLFNAKAAVDAIIEHFSSDDEILSRAREKKKRIEQMESERSRIRDSRQDSLLDMRENQQH